MRMITQIQEHALYLSKRYIFCWLMVIYPSLIEKGQEVWLPQL